MAEMDVIEAGVARQDAVRTITETQGQLLGMAFRAAAESNPDGMTVQERVASLKADFKLEFGIRRVGDLPAAVFDAAQRWIRKAGVPDTRGPVEREIDAAAAEIDRLHHSYVAYVNAVKDLRRAAGKLCKPFVDRVKPPRAGIDALSEMVTGSLSSLERQLFDAHESVCWEARRVRQLARMLEAKGE